MIPLSLGLILYVLAQFNPSCRSLYYSTKANLLYSKKYARQLQVINDLNLSTPTHNEEILQRIIKETLIKNTYAGETLSYKELLKVQFQELNSFSYYGDHPVQYGDVNLRLNDDKILDELGNRFNQLLEKSKNEHRSKDWSISQIVQDLAEYYFDTMNSKILYNFNHEVFITHVNYILMSRYVHFYPINFSPKVNPLNDLSLKTKVNNSNRDDFVKYFIEVFQSTNKHITF